MTTAAEAYEAIKGVLDASDSGIAIPLRWQGEDGGPLPDTPEAFAYVVFAVQGAGRGPTAYGGGRSRNLYRNQALVEAYVFTPNGEGLAVGLAHAETIANALRSYRDDDVSCFSADVVPLGDGAGMAPPGISRNEANSYFCVLAEVTLHFDQIG